MGYKKIAFMMIISGMLGGFLVGAFFDPATINLNNSTYNSSDTLNLTFIEKPKDVEKPEPVKTNIDNYLDKYDERNIVISDEVHWKNRILTYGIDGYCPDIESQRIHYSIYNLVDELNNTILFNYDEIVDEGTNIKFYCRNYSQLDYLGLTTYWQYADGEITGAEIELFEIDENHYAGKCPNFPATESHELLHAFGVEHSNNSFELMYQYEEFCPSKIENYIIEDLYEIYSIKEKGGAE